MRRIRNFINDKSGASLVFVLSIMLLLIAIGTSALVAASASAGTKINQTIYNQLNIYADSLQKNLMYSLQMDLNDPEYLNSLGAKFILALYNAKDEADNKSEVLNELKFSLNIVIDYDTLDDERKKSIKITTSQIKLTFKPIDVFITKAVGSPANEPKKATVNAIMTATVTIESQEKKLNSLATYKLTDGYLEEQSTGMVIKQAGEWRLMRHEKIDVIN